MTAEPIAPSPPSSTDDDDDSVTISWSDHPKVFADAVIGIASAGGIARITLGALEFNPDDGAKQPLVTSVLTLIMHEGVLLKFAHQMVERAADRSDAAKANDGE